jgi:tetratricopeptide (TPR) repeat protein
MGPAGRAEGGGAVDFDGAYARVLLGGGLPPAAEESLVQAGLSYHADDLAESHLREAEALAPEHAAVLIGFYRFYFYKGRLEEALEVARRCLVWSGRENNFSTDWRLVQAHDADFTHYEAVLPRFFLFSLKGYAYLQLRLGALKEGKQAIDKLLQLDPSDKIGARVLLGILGRAGGDDDE